MEKTKVQGIIFAVLILIVVLVWSNLLLKRRNAAVGQKSITQAVERGAEEVDYFEVQKELESKRPRLEWKTDPFQLQARTEESGEFVLSGIAADEKGKIAIINGEIIREGDVLGEIKIIQIKEGSVIIERDNKAEEIGIYGKEE